MSTDTIDGSLDEHRQLHKIRQAVGYLIDAAETNEVGEYIVPGDSVEDLRELVFGKRGDIT